jgi:hypothetical protein
MERAMEEVIAKAFIYPNKRKRFLFDRFRPRRDDFGGMSTDRFDALCRLPVIVDASLKMMKSNHFPPPAELVRILRNHGGGDTCLVLSEYGEFDGVFAPLAAAVEALNVEGFPSLIVALPSGFAHLKEESMASFQPNCFVKPRIRLDGARWDD